MTKPQGAEYHLRVLVRKIKAPYYNEKEAMALILKWHNEQCYKCNKQLTEGEIADKIECGIFTRFELEKIIDACEEASFKFT